jgi:putative transposase
VLITRLFGVSYTLRGTCYLLHRMGFTPRSRRTGRDEGAIAAWRSQEWAKARG